MLFDTKRTLEYSKEILLKNCVLFLVITRDTTWRSQQDFKKQTENFYRNHSRKEHRTEPRSKGIGRKPNIYTKTMAGEIPAVY